MATRDTGEMIGKSTTISDGDRSVLNDETDTEGDSLETVAIRAEDLWRTCVDDVRGNYRETAGGPASEAIHEPEDAPETEMARNLEDPALR
jgi:hypothetical protein